MLFEALLHRLGCTLLLAALLEQVAGLLSLDPLRQVNDLRFCDWYNCGGVCFSEILHLLRLTDLCWTRILSLQSEFLLETHLNSGLTGYALPILGSPHLPSRRTVNVLVVLG